MDAIQEINGHTYLVDGTKLLAYIKSGTAKVEYFDHALRFDRRGRKFLKVPANIFKIKTDNREPVQGSKGNVYWVNRHDGSCTCPGFIYHGTCKHLRSMQQ